MLPEPMQSSFCAKVPGSGAAGAVAVAWVEPDAAWEGLGLSGPA